VTLVVIAAIADNGVIGRDNKLYLEAPKRLEALPGAHLGQAADHGAQDVPSIGRPLPGRETVVLTRDPCLLGYRVSRRARLGGGAPEGRRTRTAMGAAETMVVGGAEVFALAIRTRNGSTSPWSTPNRKGIPSSHPSTARRFANLPSRITGRVRTTRTLSRSSISSGGPPPQAVDPWSPRHHLPALTVERGPRTTRPKISEPIALGRGQGQAHDAVEQPERRRGAEAEAGRGATAAAPAAPGAAARRRGRGGGPPDLEDILRRGQDRIKDLIPAAGRWAARAWPPSLSARSCFGC
jgi:hypothetical protein